MFTWKRFILASGGLILLVLILASLLLPGIIIDKAQEWVTEKTSRDLKIESVRINPFSLTIEIHKLSLSEADQTRPFISWDLLRVSLSIASLYHRAPVIDELHLNRPDIQLERLTTDRFNFSDLIPKPADEVKNEPAGEPIRFSVNNISINGGRIDFIDSSLPEQVHHRIRDLQLALPSIGNFPYMVEDPAQPLFQAVINDSPIDLKGELKPFSNVQELQFDLQLADIDLPFYLGYVPIELPIELRNGKLNLDLDILYRISEEAGGEVVLSGRIDLTSLRIHDRLQEQLFFMPLLQVEIAPSQPLQQAIHLSTLRCYNLEVQLKRDQQGEWNHARMASAEKPSPTEEEQEETASSFKLLIDTIEVRDGTIFFSDNLPAGGFSTVARAINIDIKDFALDAKDGISLDLSLHTDRDESVTIKGHFLLDPFTLSLQTDLQRISLGAYEPYYRKFHNQPLGGTLGLEAGVLVDPEQPLLISNGKVSLRDFYSAFNNKEGVGIDQFDIAGLSFGLAENRLAIDAVSSSDARINFSRDNAGEWSFMSRNFPILATLAEAADKPPEPQLTPAEPVGPAFSYQIGALAFSNWDMDIRDNLPATPAIIEIDDLTLNIKDMAAPEKIMSPFTFGMTLQRKGRVELVGTTSLADQETSVTARLKKIPLATLAPYVAEQTNLVLADGSLNARLVATVAPAGKLLKIGFGGNLGISRMHLLDATHHEDLLKWDSLQIAGIKGSLSPLSLVIDSVTLSDYFAKVLIDEEAQLNLTDAFSKETGEGTAVAEESEGTKETDVTNGTTEEKTEELDELTESSDSETPDIRIGKVILQGGQVDFTDRSLPHPFHADMRELGGRIEGLSSSVDTRAEVDLRGNLRSQSPLNITGTINPLAEELFLDLKLSFRDIEMSPFSPYAGNFVGYMIEKGKLNLDLEYSIENNQLKANNKVFLDQFSFGAAVESEEATSLPVNLAIALLKDGKGEIHLDIPVFGSLDDPQFSIAGVVWTIIKNLLVKAATSPFALLGALIGGSEEDFSNVSFEHGSTRLSATEQDKLLRMAQALIDRPSLEVEVSGFIDPDNDAEGYRREQLNTQIKRLKYLRLVKEGKLAEGLKEEDVTIPADEYLDYLWTVYRKTDFPKPRNYVGMTKKLPEAEMEKLIYANTPVTEEILAELAQARALTVQSFLIAEGKLAPERVFLKKPDIMAAPDQETVYRARVELGATVR